MRGLGLAVGLGLGFATVACTSVQPVKDPVPYLERNNPEFVRLYSPGKEMIVLRSPRLMSDGSVRGFDLTERADVQYALHDFQVVEAKQLDKHRTVIFGVSAAAVLGTTIYGLTHQGNAKQLACDSYVNGAHCASASVVPIFSLKF